MAIDTLGNYVHAVKDDIGLRITSGRHFTSLIKLAFHDADTDILAYTFARIVARMSVTVPGVILVASRTTRRHSRDDPREDVGEDVGVGGGVGVVECEVNCRSRNATARYQRDVNQIIIIFVY